MRPLSKLTEPNSQVMHKQIQQLQCVEYTSKNKQYNKNAKITQMSLVVFHAMNTIYTIPTDV